MEVAGALDQNEQPWSGWQGQSQVKRIKMEQQLLIPVPDYISVNE